MKKSLMLGWTEGSIGEAGVDWMGCGGELLVGGSGSVGALLVKD